MGTFARTLFAWATATLMACGQEPNAAQSVLTPDPERAAQPLRPAGIASNGEKENGTPLGDEFYANRHTAKRTTGSSTTPVSLLLDSDSFKLITGDGSPVEGIELQGMGAKTTKLRITSPLDTTTSTGGHDSVIVSLYTVKAETTPGSGRFDNICGSGVKAIAVQGRYDDHGTRVLGSDDLTFACPNSAIYKCAVDLAYWPWGDRARYHQACTRMIRADYCGNGKPFTIDGILINVEDDFRIQKYDTMTPGTWTDEAAWSETGAVCMSHKRLTSSVGLPLVCSMAGYPHVKKCLEDYCSPPECEIATAPGALLRNKSQFLLDVPPASPCLGPCLEDKPLWRDSARR